MKRGQISIFIIIAIIIAAVIGVILILKGNSIPEESVSPEIQPIYSYYENCIRDTGERAIYSIGWSGGYYTFPNYSTENGIAYYYMQGKNYTPSKNFIEFELSKYMNSMLIYCSNGIGIFKDYNIIAEEPKTASKIESGKVIFNINYPLTITKGKASYYVNNFNVPINSRLKEIYDFSINITNQEMNEEGKVCLSCINDQANEKDFYFEMNDYDNETEIFTIVDKKIKIIDNDYRFNFANKYEV